MDDDLFPGDLTGIDTAQDFGPHSPPPSRPAAVRPDEPRHRRRTALLLLAAVPWLVLAVVMRSGSAATVTEPAPVETGPTEVATTPAVTSTEPAVAYQVHGNVVDPANLAGAVAVVVARTHLGTAGPSLTVEGVTPMTRSAYVEHVAVERVDMPTPGAAVVTVVAVLLTARGDTYDGVEVIRLAVPVGFDGERAAPAGQPWRLAPPTYEPVQLTTTPDQTQATSDAAMAALESAGFTDLTDLVVATTDGWPVVVEVTGVAPGDTEPGRHVVWLRRHLRGFVVAGSDQEQQR